jgi:uncharacterized protein (UPF0335 family)
MEVEKRKIVTVDLKILQTRIRKDIEKLEKLEEECRKINSDLSNERANYWMARRHGYIDMGRVLMQAAIGNLEPYSYLGKDNA